MGGPRLSIGFWVDILPASATGGFRVNVLASLEFSPERGPMGSVDWEWSLPNTPESGVDHNNICGWRIIDVGLIKLYGMRLRLGLFNTRLLGGDLLGSRIREGLMNKKISANDELWRFP